MKGVWKQWMVTYEETIQPSKNEVPVRRPKDNDGAENIAKQIIRHLDGDHLSRKQVRAVAEWVHFLSTQQ